MARVKSPKIKWRLKTAKTEKGNNDKTREEKNTVCAELLFISYNA